MRRVPINCDFRVAVHTGALAGSTCTRAYVCVYLCPPRLRSPRCVAAAAAPLPADQGIPSALGPVSVVGDGAASVRPGTQRRKRPPAGASVCSAALCMKLFKEGNRDRRHL